MNILGISCGHDAAACLISNGAIVADIAEERFTRVKHDAGFPLRSIDYCLRQAGLRSDEIDHVAIGGNFLPAGMDRWFIMSSEQVAQLASRRPLESRARQLILSSGPRDLPVYFDRIRLASACRMICIPHHFAHAAAAYFTSGARQPYIIATMDGIGDDVSTAIWLGTDNEISSVRSFGRDASLGWFYGNVTEALGWQHGDGEGTTMALASYGTPEIVGTALDGFHPRFERGELVTPHDYGQASFVNDHGTYHWHFSDADKIRKLADKVGREHVAARAQQILEEQVIGLLRHWTEALGVSRLAAAGGIFLNVKLNQRIRRELPLQEHWTYPNPGDAGLAAGAALAVWHEQARPRSIRRLETLCCGPSYTNEDIRQVLDARRLSYTEVANPSAIAARLLAAGRIVGWFQGRMEAGPRALGGRSILMAATNSTNKDKINAQVKFREGFRPFCPSVLHECMGEYLLDSREEGFMITAFDVVPAKRKNIPAVVHVDGTVRPQTVRRETNPAFYDLIRHFGDLTGDYLVLNTSFNVKGEPIVCSPRDALRCFFDTGIEALIMGNYLLTKPETESSLPPRRSTSAVGDGSTVFHET